MLFENTRFWLWRVCSCRSVGTKNWTTVPECGAFQISCRCDLVQSNRPVLCTGQQSTHDDRRPSPLTVALALDIPELCLPTSLSSIRKDSFGSALPTANPRNVGLRRVQSLGFAVLDGSASHGPSVGSSLCRSTTTSSEEEYISRRDERCVLPPNPSPQTRAIFVN